MDDVSTAPGQPQGLEPILTARELVQALTANRKGRGVSVQTVYRMHAAGLIPGLRVGAKFGGVRFLESSVREALHQAGKSQETQHPVSK